MLTAGFTYNAYQGGKVLFGTLQEKHRLRASRATLKGSVNDVLLETANRYYDLILNEALLAIRTRAVAISVEQLRLNAAQDNQSLVADIKIEKASVQIQAAEEELRIARKRMEAGVGLNIDVLNAQRDLT